MATLQGKAVKNTYRQVLQIGANNIGVTSTLQPVQDGAGVSTALSLSTITATVNGDLTVTGDLIITGGGFQIKELIDDTVAALIRNGIGITWTYNDAANSLTGNFTGTTSVVPEGSNLYYTQGRFDSAFAAKTTTNLAEGSNLYFTAARGNANFATNLAASDTDDLAEGATNLYYTNTRARTALSVTAGTGISYNNTTGVFNLAAIPNASLTNSSITINGQGVSLGGSVTLTTTNIGEGSNLYWTAARGNANFTTNLAASSTTNLAEGSNLYYTQARFDTAFSNKSTTNLAEGNNLYYTQARFNSALAAKTTTDLAEGTNLYYTDARARLALSSSATGLTYANNSGVFSLTAGYAIPTTVKLGQYDIAYNRSIVSAAVSGTSTKTLSLTQQDANVITATWTDQGITTINGTANQIATTTVGNTTTVAFTNDVTMPNNLVVSGNLTINGTATFVNTESISSKDPLFEVANTNNTTDAVDIGYYGRYYDAVQERVEFTGLFRDASDAGKFKIFTGLVDEPTNVVNTTGTGYTVATLVANVDGNLNGTANAANILSTARTIAASGDATWSVSFNGSANVSSALTLANTGVTATTYGTSTAVPTIAVDSKGRITSASNTNITFPVTTVNGQAGTVVLTTSDIAEGSNQYFTTARAQAAISGTAPISVASGVVSISQSGGASNGFLSSTDWNTFNNKQAPLNGTGFVKISGTTISYDNSTYLTTSAAASTYLALAGGTLTGGLSGTTGTFSGILTTPQVKAATSAGLSINANSGTQVADFGAGGSANITFFGGLAGTSATFSSTLGVTGALSGTSATFSGNLTIDTNTLFVDSTNNRVGIGTSNPTNPLHIVSNTVSQLNVAALSGNTNAQINLEPTGTGIALIGPASAFPLAFRTDATERMRITSGGNVLIGTNTFYNGGFSGSASGLNINSAVPISLLRESSSGNTFYMGLSSNAFVGTSAAISMIFLTSDFERMRITSGGNVGIGTNSPSQLLDVRSSSASAFIQMSGGTSSQAGLNFQRAGADKYQWVLNSDDSLNAYNYTTGNISFKITSGGNINMASLGTGTVTATSGTLSTVSDMNLKDEDGFIDNALEKVLKLKPRYFHWKEESGLPTDLRQLGFYAQEVNQALGEEAANTPKNENDKWGIYDRGMIAFLTAAIQEQQAQIEELKAMIAAK